MNVIKRGNRGTEPVYLDKITTRLRRLCDGIECTYRGGIGKLDPAVDPVQITIATVGRITKNIETSRIDMISADVAENRKLIHPHFGVLAGRIYVSNLHKSTPTTFSEATRLIAQNIQVRIRDTSIPPQSAQCKHAQFKFVPCLMDSYMEFVERYAAELDSMIIHENDYQYSYTSMRCISRYLMRDDEKIYERPQYMLMRVAVALFMPYINTDSRTTEEVLTQIREYYTAMSELYFTHASPTLSSAGMRSQQLLSCFLLCTDDSAEDIMETLSDCALISKSGGGIGVCLSDIRAEGQRIYGTNGKSTGIIPHLRVYDALARFFNQGSRRKGAIAITMELHHGDIRSFLMLKRQLGKDEERARDLFYAVYCPQLFIRRCLADEEWSLFSEDTAPGLSDVYDGMLVDGAPQAAYTELYMQYEAEGRAVGTIRARELLDIICDTQRDTGVPYVVWRDAVNMCTNHKNVGTIKTLNLCVEIAQWSSKDSYGCCTLASINVCKFARVIHTGGLDGCDVKYEFDHERLHKITRMVTRGLDRIADITVYPVDKCRANNLMLRPMAIGIQGLSDMYSDLRMPYDSPEAERLDLLIAETIYHGSLTESVQLAREFGPYDAFAGSPASQGLLRLDLHDAYHKYMGTDGEVPRSGALISGFYDWARTREECLGGLRHSLRTGWMPTVTTSQIMGKSESFEPRHANVYTLDNTGGKMTMYNESMVYHLLELGLWTPAVRREVTNTGSLAGTNLPARVKHIYRTVWEIPQKGLMLRAAKRQAFVDQSMSLNIHIQSNSQAAYRSIFMYGAKIGLLTGSYYVRTLPVVEALKNNAIGADAAQSSEAAAEAVNANADHTAAGTMGTTGSPARGDATSANHAGDDADSADADGAGVEVCYPGCGSCSG